MAMKTSEGCAITPSTPIKVFNAAARTTCALYTRENKNHCWCIINVEDEEVQQEENDSHDSASYD